MRGWKKTLVVVASLLVAVIVVGLPALVGVRPFIGPKARPLTDRRWNGSNGASRSPWADASPASCATRRSRSSRMAGS
jgi:hypothetical protein